MATVTHEITVTSTESLPAKSHDPVGLPGDPFCGQPASNNPATSDEVEPYSVTIAAEPRKKQATPGILHMRSLTRDAAYDEVNVEAWLYARVAILFYIALLVTWVRFTCL